MNRALKRLCLVAALLVLVACAWLALKSFTGPDRTGTDGVSKARETRAPDSQTVGAEGKNAAGQTSAVMPSARRPSGIWLTKIPLVMEYIADIAPGELAVYQEFRRAFPQFDPTDRNQFAEAVMARRGLYPEVLSEADSLDFSNWLVPMEEMQKALIAARASHIGIPVNTVEAGDKHFTLVGFDGVNPLYLTTCNVNAAASTAANRIRLNAAFDPALSVPASGEGHYVNVNDHGTIYEHMEFQLPESGGSRILLAEVNDAGNRSHMTHVAGTVAAWGYNSSLIGMAPRMWIRSIIQQSTSDITTYGMQFPGQKHGALNPRTGEPQLKSIIGTTSLGYDLEFHNDCIYTSTCASFDTTLRDYPYYSHFFAASNNGSNYLTLGNEWPMCKNIFTIGSVSDVSRDSNGNYISGGSINSFSARGPTFDGRIKPDLTANGDGVTSTDGTSGSSVKSGTSMATPNASGSAALLVDYISKKLPGHHFRSSTLKALLVNTATDRGNSGPDYYYGWGIINVKAAAEIVKRYGGTPASRVVLEDELSPNETWTATYQYDGSGPIRATLAWIDAPGSGQSNGTTDRSPRLVNNLNLRLVSEGGTVYQPFVMPFTTGSGGIPAYDASLYSATATTGDNFTDNVEQVLVASPPAGTYTLRIDHGGSLLNGNPQNFSLAVTGMAQTTPVAPVIGSVSPAVGNATDNFALTIDGSGFLLGSDVILRRAGSADVTAYGVMSVDHRILCRIDSAAMAKGYWDLVVRAPGGTENILTNGFLMPAGTGGRGNIYTNNFENGSSGLTLGSGWSVAAPNKGSVGGPITARQGSGALVSYAGGNYPANVNTHAVLPPIGTIGQSGIQLSFQRWLGLAYNQGGNPSKRHADYGRIQYSTDNISWTNLYANTSSMDESGWTSQTYNLPSAAEGREALYLRFQLQTDANSNSYGWSIDDLNVSGISEAALPPAFTSIPPATADVGQSMSYTVTTTDPDTPGPALAIAATGVPGGLSFVDHRNGTGTLSGIPSQAGSPTISITVSDGSYTTYQIFDLNISGPPNQAPVIVTASLPDAVAGSLYTASVAATDGDGDPVSLGVSNEPVWLDFTDHGDGTGTLSGTPPVGSQGTLQLDFLADDGQDQTPKTLALIVLPKPNSPPVILTDSLPDAMAGSPYTASINTADGDSDPVSLSISNEPVWLDFTDHGDGTGTLSGTPPVGLEGTLQLGFLADDGQDQTPKTLALIVQPKPNSPPVILTDSLPDAVAGSPYTASIAATDGDSDPLSLSISNEPIWLDFTDHGDGTGTLSGTPPVGSEGTLQLGFLADDGQDQTPKTLALIVQPKPNTAPTISSIADLSIRANTDTGALVFSIADGETSPGLLEVTAVSSDQDLVPGGNLVLGGEGADRTLTVTPVSNKSGTTLITVTVSDGELTANTQFELVVEPVYESWIHDQPGVNGLTGPDEDPDGDGIFNLMEYALDGQPGVPDPEILPVGSIAEHGENRYLQIAIHKNSAANDIRYIVEVGSDLINWQSGGEHTTLVEETDDHLTVHDNTPVIGNAGPRFIRLKVEKQ